MTAKPSRKDLRKQDHAETLAIFDQLPDSAFVRPQVIVAHSAISMATFWRRLKSGALPALKGGRMNVGEYRRAISQDNAAA